MIHLLITIGGGSYARRICGSGPAVFVHLAETLVPPNYPLRKIRALVCDALGELNRSFGKLLERRMPLDPSEPIAAQALYDIRSKRRMIEQLDYNQLYC